jgi:hypothetical protein
LLERFIFTVFDFIYIDRPWVFESVRTIMKLHDGDVTMESLAEKMTVFTLSFKT